MTVRVAVTQKLREKMPSIAAVQLMWTRISRPGAWRSEIRAKGSGFRVQVRGSGSGAYGLRFNHELYTLSLKPRPWTHNP